MSPLEKEIFSTLAYCAALGVFCLTPGEIRRYRQEQGGPANYFSVLRVLEALRQKGHVCEQNGYWALENSPKNFYTARIRAQKVAEEKRRIFRGVCRFFPYIPFVRGVELIGSVARENASPHSDIDVCVVCAPEKLWTARFLVTVITHLSGKRRHHDNIRDRICLNYYVAENMDITARLDRASRHVHAQSISFWGRDVFASGRLSAWAFRPSPLGLAGTRLAETLLRVVGYAWLERVAERVQRAHIERSIAQGKGGNVRIARHSLTFHLLRSAQVGNAYKEIMKNV